MKILFYIIFFGLSATIPAMAQPTLTAATSTPTAGLHYPVFQNSQYLPGSAGAAQNWDFSSSSFTLEGNQAYESCNAVNLCSLHPGTTVVGITPSGGGDYIYLIGSPSALSIKGIGSFTEIQYGDPEDLFRFPLSYGSNYVDTWSAVFTYASIITYRSGNDSVLADGWGTLKTPVGTYNNVLRIQHIQTYRDSAVTSGNATITNYKVTTYGWSDATHPDVLYSTSTITVTPQGGVGTTTNHSGYSGIQMLGVTQQAIAGITWDVSPNPAKEYIQAAISLNSAGQLAFSLTDIFGRIVRTWPAKEWAAGSGKISLNMGELPAGIYTLRLQLQDGVVARKIVIE